MLYGYIRVSSKEQNLDRQRDALLKYGVVIVNIYADKESGKNFEKTNYKRLRKKLRAGDCVIVTSLDRLGRNYVEIQAEWRKITRDMQVDIVVLDMPLLNTTLTPDNLTGRFIADLVLQILSYVAETERNNIKKRQAEGILAAKSRGVKFGRKIMQKPRNFDEIVDLWIKHELTAVEAARRLQVSRAWFYKQITIKNKNAKLMGK